MVSKRMQETRTDLDTGWKWLAPAHGRKLGWKRIMNGGAKIEVMADGIAYFAKGIFTSALR